MVILGFMINYALRVNLTLAIVAMVKNTTSSITDVFDNSTIFSNNTDPIGGTAIDDDDNRFEWNKVQQGIIFGSFYWGYLLTELPGGRLSEMIGGRRVFGHSMLWASLITAITPLLAFSHYYALVCGRVFLGLMLGEFQMFIKFYFLNMIIS